MEQYEALERATVKYRVQREQQRVVEEEEKTKRLSMVMRAQSEHQVEMAAAEHRSKLSEMEQERLMLETEARLARDVKTWTLESKKLQNDRYMYHKIMEAQRGTQRTHLVVQDKPNAIKRMGTLPFWLSNPFASFRAPDVVGGDEDGYFGDDDL